ncbi:hypothetical protein GCM10009759_55520 [Kitasatospora saccharophila]|uniref:Uncharacterized protein n=1 Tax=Kitasatospora saccharophila TaxID=407973 RepID=A0ABN2XKE6_9ACTN
MRIVMRREDEDTQRLIRTLREQLAEARGEAVVQSSANGRLTASAVTAQAELANNNRVLLSGHRVLREENAVLRERVRLLAADRDGLLVQLDRALGYDDAVLADIAAGAVDLKKKASTTR